MIELHRENRRPVPAAGGGLRWVPSAPLVPAAMSDVFINTIHQSSQCYNILVEIMLSCMTYLDIDNILSNADVQTTSDHIDFHCTDTNIC